MQRKRLQMGEGAQTPSFRDFTCSDHLLWGRTVPPAKPEVQKLRERGIYSLSDGREFVAHAVFRGGYVFYTPEAWDLFGSHAFESDADGRLRWNGQREPWRTEDLIDTKRTARNRSSRNA